MLLVTALAALALLLWATALVRYGSVMSVVAVLLSAGVFFGPFFFYVDGPFQISSERLLFGALLGIFAVHRRLGWTDPKRLNRGDWLLVGFCLYIAVSSQIGGGVSASGSTLARWLFYIAVPVGMYFVARGSRVTPQNLWWLQTTIMLIGGYAGMVAWLEGLGLHGWIFPTYIADPATWEFFGRARGPLMNPSANGILLTGALGMGLSRWFFANRLGKLGLAFYCGFMFVACYFTLTRCVWLGAVVVCGALVYLRMPRRLRIGATCAALLAGGALVATVGDDLLLMKRDKQLSASASLESVKLRPLLAVVAWEMFQQRPLMGHGFGHYLDHNKTFVQTKTWDMPLTNAADYVQHNIFLSILVDTGLIGFVMYAGILAWWAWLGWQLIHRFSDDASLRGSGEMLLAFLVAYLVNGMFQDATIFPMIHMILFSIAGTVMAIAIRGGYPVGIVAPDKHKPRYGSSPQRQHQGRYGNDPRNHHGVDGRGLSNGWSRPIQ